MKRALWIVAAILAVVLVCPAATPSAKSLTAKDSPTTGITIIAPSKGNPGGPIPGLTGDGSGDDGDADDLGVKTGIMTFGLGTVGARQVRSSWQAVQVWWMYVFVTM